MPGPLDAGLRKVPKQDNRLQRQVADLADLPAIRDCLLWFHRNKQWINEQHLQLCRVPAPTFLEEKRADWMSTQFRNLGWDARLDRAGNVVAYPGANRDGPFIALTAHLDTVLAPRSPDDVRVSADGRFHGPGVSDNGAGLAALLAFAAAWKATPPVSDWSESSLLLVANIGEEGEGNLNGMRFLCKSSSLGNRIRTYLVLDGPSTDHITCRALASRRFEIVLTGPGGHSWSDHGTANPVHAISRAVHFFNETQCEDVFSGSVRTSYNFGIVEGGVSINSIPNMARAKLDIRSEDPQRIEELARCLSLSVERAVDVENIRATSGRIQAKIKEIGARPGGSLPDSSRLLPCLKAVDSHLGIRAHLDCASTDANIPLSMGLEAVSIGAGGQGGGAHTPEEWFDPDGRELGLHRILLTLCLLMNQ